MNTRLTNSRIWKWYQRAVILGLIFCGFGCSSPMSLLWFLNRGDGKVPAQYKFDPVPGKKELTVAVVVTTNPSLQMSSPENAGLDRELMTHITNVLNLETRDSKLPIKAIDPSTVLQVKAKNPALWETGSRGELAKTLKADYLLEVYVNSFVLDSRQFGGEITTGNSSYTVAVYRAGGATEPVHTYPDTFNPEFRDTRSMNPNHYRIVYVRKLAEVIARKHIDHIPDRDRSMDR